MQAAKELKPRKYFCLFKSNLKTYYPVMRKVTLLVLQKSIHLGKSS